MHYLQFMKGFIEAKFKESDSSNVQVSAEDRNLLSVAYKNVVGSRRSAWRVISSMEQKKEGEAQGRIKDYRKSIENELTDICKQVIVSCTFAYLFYLTHLMKWYVIISL